MPAEKGSLTVEAVIALPFFLSFFFLLLFLVRVVFLCLLLDQAVSESAKKLAASAYPLSLLEEKVGELTGQMSPYGETSELPAAGEILSFLDSGLQEMFVSLAAVDHGKHEVVKELLSQHLTGTELKVDELELQLVQLPWGEQEDVVLQVAYTLQVPFPFFRNRQFTLVHTAAERAWLNGSNGVFTRREERNVLDYEEETRIVYVTKTGECYHLKDCFTIKGSKKIPLDWREARKKYRGCKHCVPL